MLVCTDRAENLKLSYYDLKWNKLDYVKPEYTTNEIIEKPKNLESMLKVAADLSQGFKVVRVDLYNIQGEIYFGELTFTPAAGIGKKQTDKALQYLGNFIKI